MTILIVHAAFVHPPVRRHNPRPRPTPRPRPNRNPRDNWPRWTDEYRVSIPDEPRPTAGPDFEPSPRTVAWNDGYGRGYDHDRDAVSPPGMPEAPALSWMIGRDAGWLARDRHDTETG